MSLYRGFNVQINWHKAKKALIEYSRQVDVYKEANFIEIAKLWSFRPLSISNEEKKNYTAEWEYPVLLYEKLKYIILHAWLLDRVT